MDYHSVDYNSSIQYSFIDYLLAVADPRLSVGDPLFRQAWDEGALVAPAAADGRLIIFAGGIWRTRGSERNP